MTRPHVAVATVTIKAQDAPRLARFWRDLLGYVVAPNHSDSARLEDPAGVGPTLLIQPSAGVGSGGAAGSDVASAGVASAGDAVAAGAGSAATDHAAARSTAGHPTDGPTGLAVPSAATIHLDLRPGDQHRAVARAIELGATAADIGQTGDEGWVVLADPEGNPFCILESASDHADLIARDPGTPTRIDDL